MSPRAYKLGLRKLATDETRSRIIEAARRLLAAPSDAGRFSIEAVAREAGVARMTVYYQFGSRLGLLEAIYDDLASRGLMSNLPAAFQQPDPLNAFLAVVDAFARFWATDRVITRRLRALALLDTEVEKGIHERDEWRRGHFRNAITRIAAGRMPDNEHGLDELVDLIYSVTSFETYDSLAGATHSNKEAAGMLRQLVLAVFQRFGLAFED
jgi:AcrR family transcriptional regulator